MATLYNPLDQFQSYSIHHVLIATRTTTEAKVFTDESKNSDTLAAIDKVANLGETIPYGNKDTAFLVIDTRRFSQFTVKSLKYDVMVNGIEKDGAHGNLATKVDMVVEDAVGISFVNFLQWLMDEKMKTNFDGMIFMLRVIFVGHLADGTSQTVQNVTIPMHLFKLELNLEYAKGTYTIEFMPNMNFDSEKHSRWINISSASRFFTGKGKNTLGDMVTSFEAELNKESAKYYTKAQAALKAARGTSGTDGKYGRLVQYQITIPKEWEAMKFSGAATANATETIFKRFKAEDDAKTAAAQKALDAKNKAAKPGQPLDTHLSVETGRKITSVLDVIFSQVKDIAALGAGVKTTGDNGSVTFYKFFTGITSTDDYVTVHVDVVPFMVPNLLADKKNRQSVAQREDSFYNYDPTTGTRTPKNYAEFDFIFTGNNKDILNFDLKLQDLQFLLASNLNLGPGVEGVVANQAPGAKPSTVKKEDQPSRNAELVNTRPYDAILLPKNTDDELNNFSKWTSLVKTDKSIQDIGTSQDYKRNLSMFYAMAPITVVMTIRGNPDIMTKFNQSSFLPHGSLTTINAAGEVSVASTTGRAQYRAEFEKTILANNTTMNAANQTTQTFRKEGSTFVATRSLGSASYAQSPVFVKVNVNGPRVDFKTGSQLVDGDFAEKLLYDNYYVVFQVTNIIEGHDFKQQITLYSHNIFGLGKLTSKTNNAGTIK